MKTELNNREKAQIKRLEKMNEINDNGLIGFKAISEQIERIKK